MNFTYEIQRAYDLAREACIKCNSPTLFDSIKLTFNHRFTRKMGFATYHTNAIELSGPLFQRATDEQRTETIIHEVCHLISYHKFGSIGRGHKDLWKQQMRICGYANPQRCHNVNADDLVRGGGYKLYFCTGCNKDIKIGPVVFKRIQTKQRSYFCIKCKTPINL